MKLVVVVFAMIVASCGYMVDDADAIRAAETLGMSDVRVSERHEVFPAAFGCGKDDTAGFEVNATNAAGRPVSALVCCGVMFKGCTVRSR